MRKHAEHTDNLEENKRIKEKKKTDNWSLEIVIHRKGDEERVYL